MILIECKRRRRSRQKPRLYNRWWFILAVAFGVPGSLFAAYEPAFVLPARLINTTAPVTGGGDLSADRTIAVSDCTASTRGTVPVPPNNTTTFLRGDCTFAGATLGAVAPTIYTSTSPVTLGSTTGLFEVIEMGTPAALTINLPATPTAGTSVCVKDGLKNFATFNATVKTTDSATVDKVAGATGFVMNQNGQLDCFIYASSGTNWYVY